MSGAFRAIACAAAGAWLGGMIVIAIVAQTTFAVMRTTDVARPNAVAGRVMAVNFQRFDYVQFACAGVIVAWQVHRLAGRHRRRRDWLRLVLIVPACGILAYSAAVLTPRIAGMQSAVAAPDGDAAMKAAFDDFHAVAVRLSKCNLALAALLAIEIGTASTCRKEPQ